MRLPYFNHTYCDLNWRREIIKPVSMSCSAAPVSSNPACSRIIVSREAEGGLLRSANARPCRGPTRQAHPA